MADLETGLGRNRQQPPEQRSGAEAPVSRATLYEDSAFRQYADQYRAGRNQRATERGREASEISDIVIARHFREEGEQNRAIYETHARQDIFYKQDPFD